MEWLLLKILIPIAVLGALVFIHEFGHFIVAKWCGVGVVKFAVGFGPPIFRFTWGETTYQVGVIPLGGFVRMIGDMPDMITGELPSDDVLREEGGETKEKPPEIPPAVRAMMNDRSRWFVEKPLWQRSAVVFAGPLFNLIFAFFITSTAAYLYGEDQYDPRPVLGMIMPNSPAEKSGLRSGDQVVEIEGRRVTRWAEVAETIHKGTGAPISLRVRREGSPEELPFTITPKAGQQRDDKGEKRQVFMIGISANIVTTKVDFLGALNAGYWLTYQQTYLTYRGLLGLLSGYGSTSDLRGPKFMFEQVQQEAERGMKYVLGIAALFSVTLAVLNLLPIPILDGGHLLFFFLEAIIGPISLRKKEFAQQVGLLFLLLLMVIAIRNDFVEPDPRKQSMFDDNSKEDSRNGAETGARPDGGAAERDRPSGGDAAQPAAP